MSEKYTNWHTYWSYAKSLCRIFACVSGVFGNLVAFAAGMAFAEIIGVIEELG